ncbi:hypothetical protein B0H16DRAFT_1481532 [Mycena metata]|uniref:Uncharacterized protein n=1 Tax=Mycena metata TaxID=1033252 RepID=A0AAD7GYE5_9AGAR|nr:hypothetical protein B0H16DRAFT_1481532 [Mycena metata]
MGRKEGWVWESRGGKESGRIARVCAEVEERGYREKGNTGGYRVEGKGVHKEGHGVNVASGKRQARGVREKEGAENWDGGGKLQRGRAGWRGKAYEEGVHGKHRASRRTDGWYGRTARVFAKRNRKADRGVQAKGVESKWKGRTRTHRLESPNSRPFPKDDGLHAADDGGAVDEGRWLFDDVVGKWQLFEGVVRGSSREWLRTGVTGSSIPKAARELPDWVEGRLAAGLAMQWVNMFVTGSAYLSDALSCFRVARTSHTCICIFAFTVGVNSKTLGVNAAAPKYWMNTVPFTVTAVNWHAWDGDGPSP